MNYLEIGLSQKRYEYAKTRIPAGTQLLSKRPEMFLPDYWPAYFSKAKGCECWDLDGRHYYDMTTNGIGACLLGFAAPEVLEAFIKCIQDGSMCKRRIRCLLANDVDPQSIIGFDHRLDRRQESEEKYGIIQMAKLIAAVNKSILNDGMKVRL